MFILSFVLEDWAIYELVRSPQHRRLAVTLVASSYVTWTYQTHTFSNSIETLVVAWSLVMIQRVLDNKVRPKPRDIGKHELNDVNSNDHRFFPQPYWAA